MLHGLLFILLLMFVFIAVAVMVVARMVFRGFDRLRDAVRQAMGFDPLSAGNDSGGYTGRRSGRYTYTHGRTARDGGSASAGGGRRQQTGGGGTTVIDGRNPEHAQRKIFSHDEGEYVDFEEEK